MFVRLLREGNKLNTANFYQFLVLTHFIPVTLYMTQQYQTHSLCLGNFRKSTVPIIKNL